ncbi:hypothetical protein FQA47_013190 [Oryzias melastigma]|uniref:Pyrin domain-containing protein n=1 Tax=Oryzias melastigma TaxID=30732 RepID=A0A834KWF8_ORYME|nr:hypothetical protein FQA47_013190 [Oryzias melastigma]
MRKSEQLVVLPGSKTHPEPPLTEQSAVLQHGEERRSFSGMGPEALLDTLEDLTDEEFLKFKWFLQQAPRLDGLPAIRKAPLQSAARWATVDLLLQTYRLPAAVAVTMKVLEKLGRNADLNVCLLAAQKVSLQRPPHHPR